MGHVISTSVFVSIIIPIAGSNSEFIVFLSLVIRDPPMNLGVLLGSLLHLRFWVVCRNWMSFNPCPIPKWPGGWMLGFLAFGSDLECMVLFQSR